MPIRRALPDDRAHARCARPLARERQGAARALAKHVPFVLLSFLLHGAVLMMVLAWERRRPPVPAAAPLVASVPSPVPITVRREEPPPPPAKPPEVKHEEKVTPREAEQRPQAAAPPRTAPNTGADRNGLMKQGPVEKPAAKKGPDQQAAPRAPPQRYQETAHEAPPRESAPPRPSPPPARREAKPSGPPVDPRRATGPGPGDARKRETGEPIASVDAYRRSLQRQMEGSPETGGEVVPTFNPAPFDRSDLAGLMRFFSMKLIAYDPERQSRRFFLECDLDGQDVKRRTDFQEFAQTMGNRGLRVNGVLPDLVQRLVLEHGLAADRVVLNAMFSPNAARYLAWKEVSACRSAGVEPKSVQSCHGTFARTSFGGWVILIDRLSLADGRELPVTDPEASLVAGPAASAPTAPRTERG